MVVWKSCKRNAITCTHMTSNDREGINIALQPPPLPSSTQTTCRLCCFLKLLLFSLCLFPPSPVLSFNCIFLCTKIKYFSRLWVGEGTIPSLTSFLFCFSSLSPEGYLNSVSMPSLLPSSYTDSKVRVLSCPVPLSCTKPVCRRCSDLHVLCPYFPFLLTTGIIVITVSLVPRACLSTNCTVLVTPGRTKSH